MEDDDEFGDLYTDVLRPFTPSFSSQQPQPTPATSYHNRPIDLNTVQSDDEEILFGAPNNNLNSNTPFVISQQAQEKTLDLEPELPKQLCPDPGPCPGPIIRKTSDFDLNLNEEIEKEVGLVGIRDNRVGSDLRTKVLEKSEDIKLREMDFRDLNFTEEDDIDVVVEEREDKDDVFLEKDENLMGASEEIEHLRGGSENIGNLEVGNEIGEKGSGGVLIPGVSGGPVDNGGDGIVEDDWDSDSEDDLQIVLNDSNYGPMGMERIGGGDGGGDGNDEDEDGEPLVIVADGDDLNHQPIMEDQDWGEEVGQAGNGETKELNDAAKVNGGVAVVPKIGYNSPGYYPFHSQFKYVRPGAAPVGPGGAPGQVWPPANIGPIPGRGRGDWRPTGIRGASPMQKGFHPGYGMPLWGNNAGRGFGSGLDFTLPSHKTIFEVDINSFEEKPWKLPGIDISDFFNFGLNEESWKEFCKHLEQFRLGTTMQSKIHVYESGRTEQDFDPDLPPELAAAAAIRDVSSENANLGKTHAGQSDFVKGSVNVRPPLPTGRAIQVESGYGERLPSIDTRPPRIRDSDAIIEIVLQDSAEADSYPGNDIADNDPSREDFRGVDEIEHDSAQEDAERFDGSPHGYDGRERELDVQRRKQFMNPSNDGRTNGTGTVPLPSEPSIQYRRDSRGHTPVYHERKFGIAQDERRTKGRARDGSPNVIPSESTMDKQFLDNQKEESVESIDGTHSPVSCPANDEIARGRADEHKDDELVLADGSTEMEREARALNIITTNDSLKDDDSVKKQKLSSHDEQPSLQDIDDREDSKAASSDSSKARSGSSKDYRKSHGGVDEDVVQDRRSTGTPIMKRPVGGYENSARRKDCDEMQEIQRHHMTIRGREDSSTHKNWEPNVAHHSHVKTESIDRRKENANSDVALQRRDEDPYGRRIRAEDTRTREHSEEMGSRNRSKVQENERSDRDEHHQFKKYLDDGSWRAHHDKDIRSLHREWDDNLKSRNENVDDLHSKRRKEETQSRRDHTEKEVLHVHGENSSRRKRERDEVLDHRKRDDRARQREDDQRYVRHKEDGLFQRERGEKQREREEWHRLKQSHEESLSKRERDEGWGGLRSGRAGEDKASVGHSRAKDEYKGSDRDYLKDAGRHGEQLKRRDRVENENFSQHRGREVVYTGGNHINGDERRARHERESSRNDRAVNASDNYRLHEKKQKQNTRKSKESEGGDYNFLIPSKRHREDHTGQISETVSLNDTVEQGSGKREMVINCQSSRKHREDVSSDDERQDSRRGRSKMERWTSHKEKDFSIGTKSSSSLKVKEIDPYHINDTCLASKRPDESAMVETVDNQHLLVNEKEASDPENKNGDSNPMEDRHLDTVAKLKKRSERFKLPMPSEKEAMAIKKMENEPLLLAPSETRRDSEVKPERPARKRRWTSN